MKSERQNIFNWNNILNIIFILTAASVVVIYLADVKDPTLSSSGSFVSLEEKSLKPPTAAELGPFQLESQMLEENSEDFSANTTTHKIILLYRDGNSITSSGSKLFEGCPESRCAATTDKSLFTKSAAVVFMASYMVPESKEIIPNRIHGNQIFVYFQGECPSYGLGFGAMLNRNFFNWTMTYRLDSDIRGHYTYKVSVQKTPKNFAAGKKKLVAWFTSHCNVPSLRDIYVKKLMRYIPVDIYGKCGNLSCLKSDMQSCMSLLRQYKFYLSFENR